MPKILYELRKTETFATRRRERLAPDFAPSELLVDDQNQAHGRVWLMRDYIDHHPVFPLRQWINRIVSRLEMKL